MSLDIIIQIEKHKADLNKLQEFRRLAIVSGGTIQIGDDFISVTKFEELIEHLKFQITSIHSNCNKLTLIK
jgi:hypothetical protein